MHNLSPPPPIVTLHQMESAIYPHCCPFPFGSKGFHGARPSRFHFKINHAAPLSLPQISTTRTPITRSFGHANCMLERFSVPPENEGSGNKILGGVTRVSLVLACVLGLFNLNPKFASAGLFGQSSRIDAASSVPDLSRIEDSSKGRVVLKSLLEKCTNPVEKLEKEYNKIRKEKNNPEEEQRLAGELVEGFMFQGKFEEARKVLNDQIGESSSTPKTVFDDYKEANFDYEKIWMAKLILYKAIVHTMLKEKEAEKWWEAFLKTCKDDI